MLTTGITTTTRVSPVLADTTVTSGYVASLLSVVLKVSWLKRCKIDILTISIKCKQQQIFDVKFCNASTSKYTQQNSNAYHYLVLGYSIVMTIKSEKAIVIRSLDIKLAACQPKTRKIDAENYPFVRGQTCFINRYTQVLEKASL